MLSKIKFSKKSILQILSLFLLSFGSFFAPSARGFSATLPIFAVCCIAAFLLHRPGAAEGGAVVCSAFLFSLAAENTPLYSLLFALGCLGFAALFALGISFFKKDEKRVKNLLIGVFFVLVALALQFFYVQSPAKNLAMRRRAMDYLKETYVNQNFTKCESAYDLFSGEYLVFCEYEVEGNPLSSTLRIGEEIHDGFFADLLERAEMQRRADLIGLLREKTGKNYEIASIDSPEDFLKEQITDTFGAPASEKLLEKMCFSVTFKESFYQKRVFCEAVSELQSALSEKEFLFDRITFIGKNGEKELFSCTIGMQTTPEELFDLCKSA